MFKYLFKKVPISMNIEDYRKVLRVRYVFTIIYVSIFTSVVNTLARYFEHSTSKSFDFSYLSFLLIFDVCYIAIWIMGILFYVKRMSSAKLLKLKIKETDERMINNELHAAKITMSVALVILLIAYSYFFIIGQYLVSSVIVGFVAVLIFLNVGIKWYLDKHS